MKRSRVEYLGVWEDSVEGGVGKGEKGVLPVRQAKVCKHQSVVVQEGWCECVPLQRCVQQPYPARLQRDI